MAIRTPLGGRGADGAGRAAGPEAAVRFDELWNDRAFLQRYCERIVGDHATAADIVQETYIRALRNLDDLERRASFVPWLATIAKRLSLNELRRQGRAAVPVAALPDEIAPADSEPARITDMREDVRAALAVLSSRERRLLLRQIGQGRSVAQLACEENTTVAAVRSVLLRARTRVREALTEAGARVLAPVAACASWARRQVHSAGVRVQQMMAPAAPVGGSFGEAVAAAAAALALVMPPLVAGASLEREVSPDTEFSADASVDAPQSPPPTVAGLAAARGRAIAEVFAPPAIEPDPAPSRATSPAPGPAPAPEGNPGGEQPGPVPPLPQNTPNPPAPDPENPANQNRAEEPEDADFEQLVYVPGSSQAGQQSPESGAGSTWSGGELFALGDTKAFCETECSVLFHSIDGGANWTKLPAKGLDAGTLLIPPDYPNDARIYALGPSGLQLSEDGGQTFAPVVAEPHGGSTAAISPGFSSGDPRILIGSSPGWVYNAERDMTTPFPGPFSASPYVNFTFADDGGKTVYAGAVDFASGKGQAVVFRCTQDGCGSGAELVGPAEPPRMMVSRSGNNPGVVFAWNTNRLYRSADGGLTFSRLTSLPKVGAIREVVDDGAGRLYVAAAAGPDATGGILVSTKGGTDWTRVLAGGPTDGGIAQLVTLSDGSLLAARTVAAGGGVLCSTDGGTTWASRCQR